MVFPTFAAYAATFGKTYNGDEMAQREGIYNQAVEEMTAHNAKFEAGEETYTQGVNQFTDLTLEEFQALPMFGFQQPDAKGPRLGVHEYGGEELAASVDWRSKGAVTPVKNQGQCGSCWAFSTVGGLEGAWEIGTGTLTSMSEQQFVDCSKANSGCNGGLMDSAFQYAEGVAVATEVSYPYTARDGSCKSSYSTAIPRGGVSGYHDVSSSTSSLQSALQQQPVSVAIEADQSVFQRYSGGVITSGCGSSLDHGVTAVGYNSDYFIVKNSWGSSWGNSGYVYISGTQCGITTSASYPTVSGNVQV
jgi:C1A family cysteine protease